MVSTREVLCASWARGVPGVRVMAAKTAAPRTAIAVVACLDNRAARGRDESGIELAPLCMEFRSLTFRMAGVYTGNPKQGWKGLQPGARLPASVQMLGE